MTAYSFSQLIDFTRTSSGTFVGSNGLIQTTPASRNLLTWTQEFDNAAWSKSATTVTANSTAAPDGTMTADTLTEDSSTGAHFVSQSYTSVAGTYTMSCYVKANGRNFVILYYAASNIGASFNLTTGAIGLPSGSVAPTSSSTQDVGNGWWRISMAFTGVAVGTTFRVFLSDSLSGNGSYTGNGTSGVFLWGAQLEQAATASDYTRNVGGLFPARFDYDPVTLAPRGILIEEQRVNLLTYSAQFDNAIWVSSNLSAITANSSASPDGTTTADLLVSAVGAGITGIYVNSFTFSALTYTQSVFVKAATGVRYIQLLWTSGVISTNYANFDLQTGAITAGTYVSASMTAFGNGWYRISLTSTVGAGAGGMWVTAVPAATSLRAASYTGNGTDSFLIWGAQLELGAFATSYIPTVASQVTRTADQASIVAPMFAPWFNASAGTFVAEFDKLSTSVRGIVVNAGNTASAGSGSSVAVDGQNDGFVRAFIENVGSIEMVNGTLAAYTVNTPIKGAVTYATNNGVGAAAGNVGTVDTTVVVPPMDALQIGAGRNNSLPASVFLNGHIRNIRFYPVRLSDLQLQALTA